MSDADRCCQQFLNRFAKPWRAQADDARTSQAAHQAALSWDDVEWFKATYPDYPLLLKGIATAEDAELAVELGVDGVCASAPTPCSCTSPAALLLCSRAASAVSAEAAAQGSMNFQLP